MLALGDLYKAGICVDRDMAYALGMYRRAAESGFAPGMMRLAEAIEHRQKDEALEWYRKAAGKAYGPAMTRLGDLLGDASWYRRAVAAEDPAAFAKLAATESEEAALPLLRRGAELGDPAAQAALGKRLEESDARGAAKWYRQAAEGGDVTGMERWAWFCEKGLGGVPPSNGEAIVWYRKAAQAGNPRALYWTALHESDPDVARVRLKKAAAARYAPAMAKLAEASGNDAMLRAAAELGDTGAMLQLGGTWLEKAAAAGDAEALARLGRTEEAAARGHAASLVKLGRFEEAARAGDPEGLYRYGLSLPDKAEGTRWVQRAAEAGHAGAMRELGLRYRDGSGAAVDPGVSDRWLRAAAAAGDPQALFETGDNRAAAEKGYAPAMVRLAEDTGDTTWLDSAAAAGYANAWTKLGQLEKGAAAGDPEAKMLLADKARNAKQAYRLYVEAADAGYAPAMLRAGDCHMEGRGTSRSEVDAVNWYRRAARAGSRDALDKLAKLGKTL